MTTKTKWTVDPQHSEIGFKVKHLMISNVKGKFTEFDADIQADDDFSSAEVDLWINAASITTNDEKRDEHLRSVDFFDVENYKEIRFISSLVEKTSKENIYNLVGELTMKDITREVRLEVDFGGIMKDPWGNEKAGFSVHGKINRKDWGLMWNATLETGGVLVSDEISISCEMQLVKTKKTAKATQLEATETTGGTEEETAADAITS
jgi:polyisoprenoid-binding protein YceI